MKTHTHPGERGLPPRSLWHPAKDICAGQTAFPNTHLSENLSGRMPKRTGWKPALPITL